MLANSTTQSLLTQEVTAKDRLPFGVMLETTDYSLFQNLPGNRDVSPEQFRRIEESMLTKQLPIPIIINEKREVIDGQGRLAVCTKHHLPVYFMVVPNLTIDDCVAANIYQTKWSQKDIIKRYAISGDRNYQNLLWLMETYKITFTLTLVALGRSAGQPDKRKIQLGGLACSDADKERASDRLDKAMEVLNEIQSVAPVRQRNLLIQAVVRCTKEPGYDHERMKMASRRYGLDYRDRASVSDTLQVLAYIYNRSKKSDYMDVYGLAQQIKIVFGSPINRFTKTK